MRGGDQLCIQFCGNCKLYVNCTYTRLGTLEVLITALSLLFKKNFAVKQLLQGKLKLQSNFGTFILGTSPENSWICFSLDL